MSNHLPDLGRSLMIVGGVLLGLGLLLTLVGRLPFIGRLPGDIAYRRGNFTFYFPLVSCIVLSLLLTLLFSLFRK
jgi:hypothetical protein